jgi:hypothetical protein
MRNENEYAQFCLCVCLYIMCSKKKILIILTNYLKNTIHNVGRGCRRFSTIVCVCVCVLFEMIVRV